MTRSIGGQSLKLYNYLKENTEYDTDLIWENLLRTENMYDIKNTLHLNYSLPNRYILNKLENNHKIGLFLHIYFEDLIDECFDYSSNLPEHADIFITTNSEEKKKKIEKKFSTLKNKLDIKVIENRGRDVSAFLIPNSEEILKYDMACFAHDKKTKQLEPQLKGEDFKYKCFENILGSKEFVCNVINLFLENPKLGLLSPFEPNHAEFYSNIGREWGHSGNNNYSLTCDLLSKLDIEINVDKNKTPVAPYGTMFWFRPRAFKKILEKDWKYEDFPKEPNKIDGTILHAVERVYPFVAQDAGYYSANLLNEEYTKIELTNLNFMLAELNRALYSNKVLSKNGKHYFLVRNLKELLGGKLSFIKLLRIYAVAKLPNFIKKPLVIIKNKIKIVFKKIKIT